jgi:glyceraldehyde 3-phosphate dehydrogenase
MSNSRRRRAAINGLGRIGRMALRRYFESDFDTSNIEIVAANDLAPADALAYLFRYDSVHGRFKGTVEFRDNTLIVNGCEIALYSTKDPRELPWDELGVDIVLECTGFFKTHEQLSWHRQAGADKVIISAPAKDADLTVVMGVNHDKFDPSIHHILSNASCTTNSLAPVAKVLLDNFGIEYLFATTVHAYTSSQALIDKPSSKKARGRSAAVSIIPSSTGAAEATSLVIPQLKGKMEAIALRIPVPDGAITEICANLESSVTAEQLNQTLKQASESENWKGILGFTNDDIVSIDIIDDSRSTIVHGRSTKVLGRNMIYMQTWYDNEWGYSCRLMELAGLAACGINSLQSAAVSSV